MAVDDSRIINAIESLFSRVDSGEVTIAEIEELTEINKMTLSNLKNGKTKIKNTKLSNALVLANAERLLEAKKEGDVRTVLFGQLWGIIELINSKSEHSIIRQDDLVNFSNRPLTTFERVHTRVIQLEPKLHLRYIRQFSKIIARFEDEDFSDDRIALNYPVYANAKKIEIIQS